MSKENLKVNKIFLIFFKKICFFICLKNYNNCAYKTDCIYYENNDKYNFTINIIKNWCINKYSIFFYF